MLATVITIIIYDLKTFIVQATDQIHWMLMSLRRRIKALSTLSSGSALHHKSKQCSRHCHFLHCLS